MMGYYGGGVAGAGGAGFFPSLIGIVVLIDLILLGFWLWKQIGKK